MKRKKPKLTKQYHGELKKYGRISAASAYCDQCDWSAQTKNACGLAAIHTRMTRHKTSGETVVCFGFEI